MCEKKKSKECCLKITRMTKNVEEYCENEYIV